MFVRIAIATTLAAGSMFFVVSAQTPRPAESSDAAVHALIAELRGIRADLADASQRTLRFQLLLARLQLQEQRIANLDRQRADISKSLMDVNTMSTMFLTQYEQAARQCEDADGVERKACEEQLPTLKATANSHQDRQQLLRMQEGELLQAIATEQGRWTDFSARLDELERSLTRK
jgi:hypothetical protein